MTCKRFLLTATACLGLAVPAMVPAGPISSISQVGGVGSSTLVSDGLAEDVLIYTDRDHEWDTIPSIYLSADYVRTPNDAKDDDNYELEVTFSADALICLMIDDRVGDDDGSNPPSLGGGTMDWVVSDGYSDTGDNMLLDLDGGETSFFAYSVFCRQVIVANNPTVTLNQSDGASRGLYGVLALANLVVTKSFSPDPVPDSDPNSRLTLNFQNTNAGAITGVSTSDGFPSGMEVASPPNVSDGCSFTDSPSAGDTVIVLSGGTVPGSSSCSYAIDVTMTDGPGTYVNAIPSVSSDGPTTPGGGTASVDVVAVSAPTVTKVFADDELGDDATTRMTIQISNGSIFALSDLTLVDDFPSGMVIAPTPSITDTCGFDSGSYPVAGDPGLNLDGGSLAASSSCTFAVNVGVTAPGEYTNEVTSVNSAESPPAVIDDNARAQVVLRAVIPTLDPLGLLVLALAISGAAAPLIRRRDRRRR